MHRIETLSQPLMTALRRMDAGQLRAACLEACRRAFQANQPAGTAAGMAMARLGRNEALSATERGELEAETQAADDAYLDAQDDDDPGGGTESLRNFSQARLGSALLLVDGARSAEPAADCIYESLSALPEPRTAAQGLLLALS